MRSINEAKSGKYAGIQIQQIASTETIQSINELFDTDNLQGRTDGDKKAKQTYRQLVGGLKSQGVHIDLLESNTEKTFPIIDKKTDQILHLGALTARDRGTDQQILIAGEAR